MATGAPTEPDFYLAVQSMASRLGAKPEDLLWVWASETGFDPTLTGAFRTISTIGHGTAVPGLMNEAEWAALPTLTPKQQLPYIEKFYKLWTVKLGRPLQDTFETYLVNAAPGLLRQDGQYNALSTMYGDPNQPGQSVEWTSNWVMDSYPRGPNEAQQRGEKLTLAFGQQLLTEGLLKGWINLGDLKAFMLRPDVGTFGNEAVARLRAAQAGTAYTVASYDTTKWNPSADQSFRNPKAPIDTRLAPPAPSQRGSLLSLGEAIVIGAIAYLALRLMRR